jgi:hypothetical protein
MGVFILVTLTLLIIHLTLTIFSCNKYYFIIDAVIIIITGVSYLVFGKGIGIVIFYFCIRGIIVLIIFIMKYINKEIIKINEYNLSHKIFMGINMIIHLFFILGYFYLVMVSYL